VANRDVSAAWQYHNATKHSLQSLRASPHVLDWANQPLPYKIYASVEPFPLPTDFPPSAMSALDAIAAPGQAPSDERIPDLSLLARLCFFSNGVTRRWRRDPGEIAFRAAACTGALVRRAARCCIASIASIDWMRCLWVTVLT
jgi:hypothetical protein